MAWGQQALQDLCFLVFGRVMKADKKWFQSKQAQKRGDRHVACVCKERPIAAVKLKKSAPVCLCVRNDFAAAADPPQKVVFRKKGRRDGSMN